MIKAGDTFVHEFSIKQEDVVMFAKISGDNNPIHTDAEFAAKTLFGRPIVHGIFSGAVFSKVFGTLFPGEGTIYMYQDLKFLAPVYSGEPYLAKLEVLEVNTEKHTGVIKCRLEDAAGKVYIDGTAKLKNNQQFV